MRPAPRLWSGPSGPLSLGLALLLAGGPPSTAAIIRAVLGPFVAEQKQPELAAASTLLIESLRGELEREPKFQWIEGAARQTAVTVLTPTNGLFASAEATLRAGRQSGADWLVNGAIFARATRTQLWVRVIDVETGTMTDVAALGFDAARPKSAALAVAALVRRAGLLTPKQHFIVAGSFNGPRWDGLAGAFAQHYRSAGYEVVSAGDAAPFLSAHFVASASRSTNETTRPQLKILPAFWRVEAHDSAPASSSGPISPAVLRVQRLGGPPDEIPLPDLTGTALTDAACRAVERAMQQTKARANASAALWQSEMHRQRGLERVDGPPLATIPAGATDRRAAIEQSMRTRAESTRASFEIALAQNPNDLEAKFWVGYANVFSAEPAEQARGRKLLEEVVAGNRPDLADRARRTLAGAERYQQRK
ncbi:MAG TPA: hypothetical protein VNU68_26705 [Verrucomicrobiae bacterium]|nr:hypothetical protein [Verrucomicrobiae bacterium]